MTKLENGGVMSDYRTKNSFDYNNKDLINIQELNYYNEILKVLRKAFEEVDLTDLHRAITK